MFKSIKLVRLLLAATVTASAVPTLVAQTQAETRAERVTGTVVDDDGEPLIGATVRVKGTTTAVATDGDGRFSVNAPGNSILVVSYVGYTNAEISINNRPTVSIKLSQGENVLDEAVVIGYGTVARRDLTGSLSSLSSKDLMRGNPVSLNQGLQGKVSGVQVMQADGAPGAGISIQIRGANTFSGSAEPLYVIDGMPVSTESAPTEYGQNSSNNPLNTISPQDIESIQVLKDASATAIYGSRAANGVVIITTKSGQKGKAKVTFSTNLSSSQTIKQIDVLSAGDFARFRNECSINGYTYDGQAYVPDNKLPFPTEGYWTIKTGIDPMTGEKIELERVYNPSPSDFDNGYINEQGEMFYGTNWQDQIFRTAFSQDYTLSVAGGSDNGTYMFSGSVLDQQGTIQNSYYKRYSVRSNNTRYINKWITLGTNVAFTTSSNRLARTNWETSGLITSAISFNPTRPVFDPKADSQYSEDFSSGLYNPYLTARTEKNVVDTYNIQASGHMEIKFTPWLKFRENIGYYWNQDRRNQYYNRYTGTGKSPTNGSARKDESAYNSVTIESTLSFDKKFGAHAVNAVAGFTYENYGGNRMWMTAKNFPNDILEDNDMSAAVGDKDIESSRWRSQLMSILARVNYGYDNRYLVTFSYRRDGSSRFVAKNRWSNFYSGALAWRLSEESFIKRLNFFNNLKLRLSAGQTGSQAVGPYATLSRFETANYPFGGNMQPGFAEDRWGGPAAPNLKWETTDQFDIGLDMAFFNNRVSLTFDAYYKKTRDLLQSRYIDKSSGFSVIACNFGHVVNKGIEIEARFIPVRAGDWTWSIDGNISFNRNRIGGLDADQFSNVGGGMESMFLRRNGHSIGTLYGYVEDGFYDNEAEVRADPQYRNETDAKVKSMIGQIKYKNFDDDPTIDDRDKVIIGNTSPDFQYGFNTSLTWKNLTFSAFFQGTYGNDIVNFNLLRFTLMPTAGNMPYFVWNNRWTPENRENATWPRPDGTFSRSMKASDRYVSDGSYLRCKNISLTYTWNKPVKYIEAANFTLSASNLFTITKYDWYDPDVNAFGTDPTRRGVDMSSYPSARTYTLGIQLTF